MRNKKTTLKKRKPHFYKTNKKRQLQQNMKGGGNPTYKVMSYNVLARVATRFQEDKHKFQPFKSAGSIINIPKGVAGDGAFISNGKLAVKDDLIKINTNIRSELPQTFTNYLQTEHIAQTIDRYTIIKESIQKEAPDIVLLQEVDEYFFSFILNNLKDYAGYFEILITGPDGHDQASNFGTAVIWNKDRFTKTASKTLNGASYTNDESFIDYLGKIQPIFTNKNASLVTLTDKPNNNNIITAVSLHIAGNKDNKPTPDIQRLINYIMKQVNLDVYNANLTIIGGDFNCDIGNVDKGPISEWMNKTITAEGFTQIDQSGISTPTVYDFDYAPKGTSPQAKIDTIYYKGNDFTAGNYNVQPNYDGNVYGKYAESMKYAPVIETSGSDHAWITTELTYTPPSQLSSQNNN